MEACLQRVDLVAEGGVIEGVVEARDQLIDRLPRIQVLPEVTGVLVALRPSGGESLFDDVASLRAERVRFGFAHQFVGLRPQVPGALAQGPEFVEAVTAGAAKHRTRCCLPAGLCGIRLFLEVTAASAHAELGHAGKLDGEFPCGLQLDRPARLRSQRPYVPVHVHRGIDGGFHGQFRGEPDRELRRGDPRLLFRGAQAAQFRLVRRIEGSGFVAEDPGLLLSFPRVPFERERVGPFLLQRSRRRRGQPVTGDQAFESEAIDLLLILRVGVSGLRKQLALLVERRFQVFDVPRTRLDRRPRSRISVAFSTRAVRATSFCCNSRRSFSRSCSRSRRRCSASPDSSSCRRARAASTREAVSASALASSVRSPSSD